MTRNLAHDDDDRLKLDPVEAKLDRLLDAALAPASAPPDLLEQILERTEPRLQQRRPRRSPVLARIGGPLFKVAAVIAVVGTVVVALINTPSNQWTDPPGVASQPASIDQIERQLADIAHAAEAPATDFDARIDLLAMQVDLVQHPALWDDSEAVADQVLLLYEIERYLGETSVIF